MAIRLSHVGEPTLWSRSDTHSLEGVVKRVNYKTGEITILADCAPWHFTVAPDCEFWWGGERTMLRCFHPLDHVRAAYALTPTEHILKSLEGSDEN
jgi:hypothetical protein